MALFEGRKSAGSLAALDDAKKRHLADPTDIALATALVDGYVAAGNRAGAIDVLTRTGSALVRKGRPADAAAVLSRVQQLDPKGELPSSFLAVHLLREAQETTRRKSSGSMPAIPDSALGAPPAAPSPSTSSSSDPTVAALTAHPMLQGVPAGIVAAIASECRRVELLAGAVLFDEGSASTDLYFVTQGELGITGRDTSGHDSPVGSVSAGEIVGELAFLSGRPRSVTARATRRTEAFALDRRAAEPILARYRKLGDAIFAVGRRREIDLVIARSRAFRTLAKDEREKLSRLLAPKTGRAGEVLVREGAPDTDFYLLKSGQAEVTKARDGRQVLVGLLEAYDCFGESSALNTVPRIATVTAITAVEFYAIAKPDVLGVVARNPSVKSELDAIQMERFFEIARILGS